MNNLIIVGIDPGTTIGYAILDMSETQSVSEHAQEHLVLDMNKNLITTGSSKQLDLNSLLSTITLYGKVIAIGTDKKKTPSLIEKFAAKTGAKIISPKEDLKVVDKKEMTNKYKTKNEHERDALASAFFAFGELRPLLRKIDVFVKNNKKEGYSDKLKEIVISKEISISSAVDYIEKPLEKEEKTTKKIIQKKEVLAKDVKKNFVELCDKLKSIRKINKLLMFSNKKLRKELEKTKQKHKYFEKKIMQLNTNEKSQQLIDQKEERLASLYKQLILKDDEISYLNNEINKLYEFLSTIGKNTLLKKLENLGYNEFESKNKILKIKEGDILLVNDANICSEKTINLLKDKINIILYKKPISKKIKKRFNFIFIDSKKLKIDEDRHFAVTSNLGLEQNKKSSDILKKIVTDYQNEKKR